MRRAPSGLNLAFANLNTCPRAPFVSLVLLSIALALLGCGKGKDAAPSLTLATSATGSAGLAADLPDLPKHTGEALVDLAGGFHPGPAPGKPSDPIAAVAMETKIFAKPDTSSGRLGTLRAGAVVETDSSRLVSGPGCTTGFRKIKPMGFVCMNDDATTDLNHPIVKASTRRPDSSQRLPYLYGTVMRGGPAYQRLPNEDDLKSFEPHLKQHVKKWERDKAFGMNFSPELWTRFETQETPSLLDALTQKYTSPNIPAYLKNGGKVPNLSGFAKGAFAKIGEVSHHNGLSFVDTMFSEGRRYGLTTDLRLVPTDRLRPIKGSDFHGVQIGKEVEFPFAIIRTRNTKRWKVVGSALKSAGLMPYEQVVPLTGKQQFFAGVLHYQTKEGEWIEDRAASKVEPVKKFPQWALNGEKWIEINIRKQLLVLYEGQTPVYATLVSTGEAGLGDPKETKSTLRGIFRIHTKHLTATMDSKAVGEEFELRDVPYVQYFQDGYALHAAYWHDAFGQPKSHGCINLSPEDARRIFFWTEPHVPEGWHSAAKALTGTVLFIHE
jgi:lipoprotein-anchoring transpeptidase ErfK/SrfK